MVPADSSTGAEAAVLIKIGDGTTAFKDLPWLSGEAADVYEWAKQSSIYTTVSGSGNVISSVTWDESLNGGKGGLSFTKGITALTSHQSIKNFYANNTNSLVPSAVPEEIAGSGTINLHRISKTGKYDDLIDPPTIGKGTLTISQNGASKGTFNANQTDNGSVSLTDTQYQLAFGGTSIGLQSKTSGSFEPSGGTFDLATILKDTFLNLTGGRLTGRLYTSGAAPLDMDEVTSKSYVDNLVSSTVAGAAEFVGTFNNDVTLEDLNFNSNGDFARCSTTYNSAWYGTIHTGDIAVVTDKTKTASTGAFTIIHGETYTMNSATADGYVAKGSGNANKVWKTDEDGNPA